MSIINKTSKIQLMFKTFHLPLYLRSKNNVISYSPHNPVPCLTHD